MAEAVTPEILFYHLEHRSIASALPELLERTLARGWRAAVQAATAKSAEAIDLALWTYADASFLPHGRGEDRNAARQPIVIVADTSNPNTAEVRFLIETSQIPELSGYSRVVFLFDGRQEESVAWAREQWKSLGASDLNATYWRQDESGRWEKQS